MTLEVESKPRVTNGAGPADVQARMKRVFYLLLLVATLLDARAGMTQTKLPAGPAGANPSMPMCKAKDLSLGTDAENGAFNGMSHSGTLLVLRNLSPVPCRVPQRPAITFLNGVTPLEVKLDIPGAKFMHPGPVLVPVVVLPEAEVTAKLRWVSGDVYENSVCLSSTTVTVKIGDATQQSPLVAHICGDKAKGVTFQATPFIVDAIQQSWKKLAVTL